MHPGPMEWTARDLDSILKELIPSITTGVNDTSAAVICPRCQLAVARGEQEPAGLTRCPHCGQLLQTAAQTDSTDGQP